MRPGRRQLAGLFLAISAFAVACGTTSPTAPRGQSDAGLVPSRMTGLQTGSRLSLDGVSVLVPPPGQGAWGAAIQIDGHQRVLGVQAGVDGAVTVYRQGVLAGGGAPARAGSLVRTAKLLSACSDSYYSLAGTSWSSTYDWYFKSSSTPSEITSSDAINALRAAIVNITHADNDCGLTDNVSATAHYEGVTSRSANIGSGSSCTGSDGTNVVDFGNLAATDLGYVCWWTSGNETVGSDMRLNSTEYSWAVDLDGCVGKYSVQDVATHEFGHTYGLNDVSESLHPALTMSLVMLPCQNAETSLGLGDVRGLQALY